MRFVIITGMSGAGKSLVVKQMEDLGFFCVDNMPPSLIPKFFDIIRMGKAKIDKVALVVDIRGGTLFRDILPAIESVRDTGFPIEVLFLEASDDALIKRFKETRRTHPLARSTSIKKGITEERNILKGIRDSATYLLDTTEYSAKMLKDNIATIFADKDFHRKLVITVISFGFKYGIPTDSDLVFDVRFIPNPFYIETMRKLSGLDQEVKDYVLHIPETKLFIEKAVDMIDYLIPYYIREGKPQLIISIGCTGGRHRSVAITEEVFALLKKKSYSLTMEHRDLDKDGLR